MDYDEIIKAQDELLKMIDDLVLKIKNNDVDASGCKLFNINNNISNRRPTCRTQ